MAENTTKTTAQSLRDRAANEPTELHKNFAEWLKANTGVEVDLKTVQLACSMRMDFQRSEDNQKDLAARKAAAAEKAEKALQAKRAKAEAMLAKLQAELAGTTEDKPEAPKAKKAKRADEPKPEMQEKDGIYVTKEPIKAEQGVKIRRGRYTFVATIHTYGNMQGLGAQEWATYEDKAGKTHETQSFKRV